MTAMTDIGKNRRYGYSTGTTFVVGIEEDSVDANNCGGWTHTNTAEHYPAGGTAGSSWDWWQVNKSIRYQEINMEGS